MEMIKPPHPYPHTMMLLHSHKASTSFSVFQIFLPFSLFLSFCAADVQTVQLFINCGSSKNATYTGQTFVGDEKSNIVSISGHGHDEIVSQNQFGSLYQTARVFKRSSSYDFKITQNGFYFVRLHFYAPSLADAKFNVTASGHMLLSDFSPGMNSTNSPIIKEFNFTINQPAKFGISFVPSPSSTAFVNAIEVLSTNPNNIEYAIPFVTSAGSERNYKGHKSDFLETKYRINVGGGEVEGSKDTLRRTWMPDDEYLMNKGEAINKSKTDSVDFEDTSDEFAPQEVYETAKALKTSSTARNLTWSFRVNKSTKHYVRVHFCDFIAVANGNSLTLYLYSNFLTEISLTANTPFYEDFVVESDHVGTINISVRPSSKSPHDYLFLNGVEIMQVKNETDLPVINDHLHITLTVVSAVSLIIVVAAVFVFLRQKKMRKKRAEVYEWGNLPLYGATSSHNRASDGSSSQATAYQNPHLKIPFAEIKRVTNNFDEKLIIGEGGFGKVYKGTRKDGYKVAVKRGNQEHGQGMAEFQTEIMILSKIRHRHLLSLIGYCYEGGEMILVYELMEKGTLRYHLYDSKNSSILSTREALSWKQRLEICIGAAEGIDYLHTGTSTGIIHRDVKSTNILLDENYVAKVADFGLSRSEYLEQAHNSFSDVKGTLGYMDPEYITCYQLTEKSDVYAFGVVLLEVLCARPVINHALPTEQINLVVWAMDCYDRGEIQKIIDLSIASQINPNSLTKFCETAKRCLKKDPKERPLMSDVCWDLKYALQLQNLSAEREYLDDSTTDASLNMLLCDSGSKDRLPAVQRFPSRSIADEDFIDDSLNGSFSSVLMP
ncbi:unnamed protein product [Amaranthus hypochondriacus]